VAEERRPSGQDVLEAVLGLAQDLAVDGGPVASAGLAVPGIVRDDARIVVMAANLDWRDLPIGQIASERLEVPVAVSHDVRAAAVAEGLWGAARGCTDYLLLTLGTGVGAAVVLGGRPYTGAHGVGGELGHVVVEPRGPLCGCGGAGCLEALASAGWIADRYRAFCGEEVGAEEVASRAISGNPVAERVWREALDALAVAICNYVTLLDPQKVVIGGGMAAAASQLFDGLRARVRGLTRFGEPPEIVPAELEEAGRWGAACGAWRLAGVEEDELRSWHVAA
jgi:glucokinase